MPASASVTTRSARRTSSGRCAITQHGAPVAEPRRPPRRRARRSRGRGRRSARRGSRAARRAGTRARARCAVASPAESGRPPSPTTRLVAARAARATKASAPASAAAVAHVLVGGGASPRRMLSATVPRKSVGRCGTHANCAPPAAGSQSARSTSPTVIAPAGRLGEAAGAATAMVLLPAPLAPTSATVSPGRELEVDAVEHRTPRSGYANETPSSRMGASRGLGGAAASRRRSPQAPRRGRAGARPPRCRRRSRGTARPGSAAAGTARARARARSAPARSRCRRRRGGRRR